MSVFKVLSKFKLTRCVSSIAVLALILTSAVVLSSCGDDDDDEQFKIGYMGDHAGWGDTEEIGNMAGLAVDHINEAGGVNGMSVILIRVNAPEATAAEDARGLIAEGVSAVVGPSRSDVVELVAEPVAGVEKVPFISPGSTRTSLRHAEDEDFMFRMALPDSVQGKVLGDLISGDDINEVSILYDKEDSYAVGLKDDFTNAYAGKVTESKTLDESGELMGGAALVVLGFPDLEGLTDKTKEVIATEKFQKYYFADTGKSVEFLDELKTHADEQGISPNPIEGSKGTGPIEVSAALREDFTMKYGKAPKGTFLAEGYDATVAIALAAQMAGSTDSIAIRDHLRFVTSGKGQTVMPGVKSIKQGLELAGQGRAVNYDGESGSVDWDSDGEVCSGKLTTWQYAGGEITTLDVIPEANPGGAGKAACIQ